MSDPAANPSILVVHSKHGPDHYLIRNKEHLYRTALYVASKFSDLGYYQDDTEANRVMRGAMVLGGEALWKQMRIRATKGYEYEYVEIVTPVEVP